MIILDALDGTITAEPTAQCIQQFSYANRLAAGPNIDVIKYDRWELTIEKHPGNTPERLIVKDLTTGLTYEVEVNDNSVGIVCVTDYLGS